MEQGNQELCISATLNAAYGHQLASGNYVIGIAHVKLRHQPCCSRLLCLLVCLAILACSGEKKTLQREDLADQVTLGASVASDTLLLIDLISAGKTTTNFVAAHRQYLAKEVQDIQRQLQKSQPATGLEQAFGQFSQNLQELQAIVERLPSHASGELAVLKPRCAALKQAMQDLEHKQ
jgi:hypothetical protein